ncbi:MAG: DUF5677 domain-containing protein [Limisphaerales bacterium]
MSGLPSFPRRFDIIRKECQSKEYQENSAYFQFSENFFWACDHLSAKAAARFATKGKPNLHEYIAISYSLWLTNQINGILLLLNVSLISQAWQLIRSIWEAKIYLMYIAKKPGERCKAFICEFDEDFKKLKNEKEKGNPFVVFDFQSLPLPKRAEMYSKDVWVEKLSEKATDIGLENEYSSIYKAFSWSTHPNNSTFADYVSFNANGIEFNANQKTEYIPFALIGAGGETFKVICEINKVLKIFTDKEIEAFNSELEKLIAQHNEQSASNI